MKITITSRNSNKGPTKEAELLITTPRFSVVNDRILGRPRRRWTENIIADLMEYIHALQETDQWRAFENMVINILIT
jgi:hypothetical protein